MATEREIKDLFNATAFDKNGDKLGGVKEVFIDDDTGQPTFVEVGHGLFGMSSSLVPMRGHRLSGDDLQLAFDKDRIKDAPEFDTDNHLTPEDQRNIYDHYGVSGSEDVERYRDDNRRRDERHDDRYDGRRDERVRDERLDDRHDGRVADDRVADDRRDAGVAGAGVAGAGAGAGAGQEVWRDRAQDEHDREGQAVWQRRMDDAERHMDRDEVGDRPRDAAETVNRVESDYRSHGDSRGDMTDEERDIAAQMDADRGEGSLRGDRRGSEGLGDDRGLGDRGTRLRRYTREDGANEVPVRRDDVAGDRRDGDLHPDDPTPRNRGVADSEVVGDGRDLDDARDHLDDRR